MVEYEQKKEWMDGVEHPMLPEVSDVEALLRQAESELSNDALLAI